MNEEMAGWLRQEIYDLAGSLAFLNERQQGYKEALEDALKVATEGGAA